MKQMKKEPSVYPNRPVATMILMFQFKRIKWQLRKKMMCRVIALVHSEIATFELFEIPYILCVEA